MAAARGLTSHVLTAVLLSFLLTTQNTLGATPEHVTCANHRQLVSCTLCASLPGVAVTQAQCCDSAMLLEECLSCLVDSSQCRNLLAGSSSDSPRDKRFHVWWSSKSTSAQAGPKPAVTSTYMKRPKYFLGKRAHAEVDKRRNRNTFLGKRDVLGYSGFVKRRGPFLGKRRGPFLGKRRGPFLGKRRGPFLGKRRGPFLGKRQAKPFLGKRSVDFAEHK